MKIEPLALAAWTQNKTLPPVIGNARGELIDQHALSAPARAVKHPWSAVRGLHSFLNRRKAFALNHRHVTSKTRPRVIVKGFCFLTLVSCSSQKLFASPFSKLGAIGFVLRTIADKMLKRHPCIAECIRDMHFPFFAASISFWVRAGGEVREKCASFLAPHGGKPLRITFH
ncbi:hypothetical protein A3726_16495 [Erythrobacter sp. HI0037]|nr:hypothetical protein A3726_16495 [Erythrobacter sp. HI0037]